MLVKLKELKGPIKRFIDLPHIFSMWRAGIDAVENTLYRDKKYSEEKIIKMIINSKKSKWMEIIKFYKQRFNTGMMEKYFKYKEEIIWNKFFDVFLLNNQQEIVCSDNIQPINGDKALHRKIEILSDFIDMCIMNNLEIKWNENT